MKLTKNKGEISQVMGAEKKMEFSIDTSNQMIVSILRDKLYANKIAAVCREVASNSRDANREAGRADAPVMIKVFTDNSILSDGELMISFKDSGVGISPDRIENVFLKYGSSTKRDTNTQTGGFGIGAKTPFAYSNEFLISTVSEHKGKRMKHIYQAVILNENGVESSQLILVSEEVTKENTGTEIIVPIKDNDRLEFEKECVKATTLWDVKPELVGFNSHKHVGMKDILNGENWSVVNGRYHESLFGVSYNGIILEIDGIPYSFDYKKMSNINPGLYSTLSNSKLISSKKSYFYGETFQNYVVKFKTGELSLSASREDIEYRKENVELIAERIFKMEEDIKSKCLEGFKKIKNKFDKLLYYISVNTHTKDPILSVYKGLELASSLIAEDATLKGFGSTYSKLIKADFYYIKKGEDFRTTKKNCVTGDIIEEQQVRKSIFVIKPSYERSVSRKNETLLKLADEKGKSGFFIISSGAIYTDFASSELKRMFEESKIDFVLYSDVELAPAKKRETNYGSNGRKVDTSVGTVFLRRAIREGREYVKDKLKYNKKEKTIESFEWSNDRKKVIVPISTTLSRDLTSFDRLTLTIDYLMDEEVNDFCLKGNKVNKAFMVFLLMQFEYDIVVVKKSDIDNISKDKNVIFGLGKAFKELLKNEKLIQKVNEYNKNNSLSSLNLIQKGDTDYNEIFERKLSFDFYSLAGIDLKSLKVYQGEIKDTERVYGNFSSHFATLAQSLAKENNVEKFKNYLTESVVEEIKNTIKDKFPLIYYMYYDFGDTTRHTDYSYGKYNKENKEGLTVLQENLHKMIKEALSSK